MRLRVSYKMRISSWCNYILNFMDSRGMPRECIRGCGSKIYVAYKDKWWVACIYYCENMIHYKIFHEDDIRIYREGLYLFRWLSMESRAPRIRTCRCHIWAWTQRHKRVVLVENMWVWTDEKRNRVVLTESIFEHGLRSMTLRWLHRLYGYRWITC